MARHPAPVRYEICALGRQDFVLMDPIYLSPRAAAQQNVVAFLRFADAVAAEAARVREELYREKQLELNLEGNDDESRD